MKAIRLFAPLLALLIGIFVGCSDSGTVNQPPGDEPVGKLYVLNQGDGTLYIYDSQTLARTDSVDTKVSKPHYIEFSPDGLYYYVTTLETGGGHIAKFDARSNQFMDSVSVPPAVIPSAIAISQDNRYGYICNFSRLSGYSKIHKYDLSTMQHVDSMLAGAMTHDLKITSDGSTIIACNRNSDNVTLIYTDADTVTFIPMDSTNILPSPTVYEPYGVIIDNDDSLAYIACVKAKQVRVLDIAARKIVDSVDIPVGVSSALAGPTLLAISPNNEVVFVTTQIGNSVVAFNTSTGNILADIPFSTPSPFGICMSDDGSRVYVACIGLTDGNGRVYVIDGATYAKVDSIDVGNLSYGLVWQK